MSVYKLLSSKDLDLANVFDVDYTADGRYRGGNTQDCTKPGSFHGTQSLKKVVSGQGGDRSNAYNDAEGQGHSHSGQKTKISAGQVSRGRCWICKSPNHRQRDCPQKSQDKSTTVS